MLEERIFARTWSRSSRGHAKCWGGVIYVIAPARHSPKGEPKDAPSRPVRTARRHSGRTAAVRGRSGDRREKLPQAPLATSLRRRAFPPSPSMPIRPRSPPAAFDEQRRVLDIAQDEIGGRLPIVNGVWADGSLEAARIARMAEEGGAAALLVFPPAPFTLGQSPAMAVEHFQAHRRRERACRSSSSNIRWQPARAIRATRSSR